MDFEEFKSANLLGSSEMIVLVTVSPYPLLDAETVPKLLAFLCGAYRNIK